MYFYLQDYISKAVFFIDQDILLVNNVQSGILDCTKHILEYDRTIVSKIESHCKLITNDVGLRLSSGNISEFSLDDYPEAKRKQELVKIRTPLFKRLLRQATLAYSNNCHGFSPADELYIQHAINKPDLIFEYSEIMNISETFAKEELSMIVDSIMLDRFRIFSLCNMWKEKINKCMTHEDAFKLLKPMTESFYMAGIPDA
jgi:hypothetical protein